MANVTLRQKKIANDKSSLYLDYFPPIISPKNGKETRREFLKLQLYNTPKTTTEKAHNKTTIEFAELIRAKRLVQIKNREFGFKQNIELNKNFVAYYEAIVTEYLSKGSKSNYGSWKASLNYIKKFFGPKINSKHLTADIIKKYRHFLLTTNSSRTKEVTLSINSAASYYKQFIYVLKRAYKDHIISENLAQYADYINEEVTFREYLKYHPADYEN